MQSTCDIRSPQSRARARQTQSPQQLAETAPCVRLETPPPSPVQDGFSSCLTCTCFLLAGAYCLPTKLFLFLGVLTDCGLICTAFGLGLLCTTRRFLFTP